MLENKLKHTVRRKIKELKNNRKIDRISSDKTGYWETIE